jgi:hypothetical protein
MGFSRQSVRRVKALEHMQIVAQSLGVDLPLLDSLFQGAAWLLLVTAVAEFAVAEEIPELNKALC